MFQIGGLVVFCGLWAQTTALPGNLPLPPPLPLDQILPLPRAAALTPGVGAPALIPALNPADLAGAFTSALSNGLLSGGLLGILKDLPLLDILNIGGHSSDGLLGGLLGKVPVLTSILNNIVDIEITNPQLLELGLIQKPDHHNLYVTIPLGIDLNVKTPLVGSLLRLAVKLNLTVELVALINEQGKIHLAVGDCVHSPGSLEIFLLDGLPTLPIQGLANSLNDVVNKVLPDLVQGKVCPLVNKVLEQLDFTLAHAIADILTHGLEFTIKV